MRWAPPAGAPRRSTSARATTCSAPSWRPAGKLQATASLYRRDGAAAASARASAASEADLFELVDELVRQLLASQKIAPGTRLGRIAALTTGSLDALRAYLQGERELRAGRYFDAMERFQAAVDADPSFALAYYRLAAAAAGCALPDLAREFADRSHEHRARLSPHDQLVLSAQRAWLDGAVGEAESLYNTITGTYPDDVEAWFHLGDLLFHLNPMRGRSATEARKPFERVVALEPDHVGAMVHLARIAAIEGRRDEMLDLVARILRESPDGDQALAMRALRAHAARDAAGMETVAPGAAVGPGDHGGDRLRRRRALLRQPRRGGGAGAPVHRGGALARAARALPHPAGAPGAGPRAGATRRGTSWRAPSGSTARGGWRSAGSSPRCRSPRRPRPSCASCATSWRPGTPRPPRRAAS